MDNQTYLAYGLKYFQSLSIDCRFDAADEAFPVDMLLLPLADVQQVYPEERATMSIFFAQPDAVFCKELQMRILHLIAYLGEVQPAQCEELNRYFAAINPQLPIGYFLADAQGGFTCRCTLPIPEELPPELFLRQLGSAYAVMNTCMGMFLQRAYQIKEGQITAQQALAQMESDVTAVAEAIGAALKGDAL